MTVTGQPGSAGDSTLITAARSKVLSRNLASGCNYMSAYSAAEDDLRQKYMSDLGMEGSTANEAEKFDENSPNGDVSRIVDPSSIQPDALFAAGRMYDLGKGVPVDQQKAVVYYKEASLKSNSEAQSALATYFYAGELVPKDLATARKLFTAAANQGHPDAMFNLGVMCPNGEAGVKDMATAYVWLALAKNAGHESAAAALKQIGPRLTVAEQAKADSVLKPMPKS